VSTRWRIAIVALVGIVPTIAACGAGSPGATASPQTGLQFEIGASWAKTYANPSELAADARLIVVGHVDAITFQGRDPHDNPQAKIPTPLTQFAVSVDRRLAGSSPNTITVNQTGGPVGGQIVSVEGDPLMVVGAKYVMYLDANDDGTYAVLGGPQGRLSVMRDGSLRTVGDSAVTWPAGASVDSLAKMVATP
jgi:hypothetical protein